MPSYAAMLRAVNLGPHNKMPKEVLTGAAQALGYRKVRTYIASGNLIFDADADEAAVKAALEAQLATYAGKAVPVLVRTAQELAAIRDSCPFAAAPGNRVLAILLDAAPPADALVQARHVAGEQMALGAREIYIRYTDDGIGQSKLVIPAARFGTGRNMNTIAKLAELTTGA